MKYRVTKHKKKKLLLETYKPKKRIEFSKERAVPLILRVGGMLAVLGGLLGFWASSLLMLIKGAFGVEERVRRFSLNNKIIEIRVRKGT